MKRQLLNEKIKRYIKEREIYKEKLIETEFIKKISEAKRLEDHYVNQMWAAKSQRTQSTYRAEATISRKNAEKILGYAEKFINRIEELMLEL